MECRLLLSAINGAQFITYIPSNMEAAIDKTTTLLEIERLVLHYYVIQGKIIDQQ